MEEAKSETVEIDHFADSFWLGQNEDPMLAMLDLLEAGGSVDALPSEPVVAPKAMSAGLQF